LLSSDDAIGAIRELKGRAGGGLQVLGSSSLARQLVEHDLVDEYRLMLEPILLGGGKRIFPENGQARPLDLVSVKTAGTGVLICAYRPRPLRRHGWAAVSAPLLRGVPGPGRLSTRAPCSTTVKPSPPE
jgi:hypothetical protein